MEVIAKSKQGMGRTASTMLPQAGSSTFSHFVKRPRKEKRLNSTIRFEQLSTKFTALGPRSMSWNKWKANNFPPPWEGFRATVKRKAEKCDEGS
jgi:hypothetical protein